jgi:hypothetical protein
MWWSMSAVRFLIPELARTPAQGLPVGVLEGGSWKRAPVQMSGKLLPWQLLVLTPTSSMLPACPAMDAALNMKRNSRVCTRHPSWHRAFSFYGRTYTSAVSTPLQLTECKLWVRIGASGLGLSLEVS